MGPFPSYPSSIPDDALDLTFEQPAFTQDLTDTVGNFGDDTDGFETLFSQLASHASDLTGFLNGFDGDLGDLSGLTPSLGTSLESDAQDALSNGIAAGQPSADALQANSGGPTGRVWSGQVMTYIYTAFTPIDWKDGAQEDVQLRLFAILKLSIHAGESPFPVRVRYHNPANALALQPVSVSFLEPPPPPRVRIGPFATPEKAGGPPPPEVFERVWHEAFSASVAGADWNIFLDINPLFPGDFTKTVQITEKNGQTHQMTFRVHVG